MFRTWLRVVAGGAVFLGVLIAIAFVRARAPQSLAPAPADISPAGARADNSQSVTLSLPTPQEQTVGGGRGSAVPPQQRVQEDRSAASTTATPERVEIIKRRYPEVRDALESVERNFAAQDTNAWAAAKEALIFGEISQKARGLEITDLLVECRTTLCRVQMAFPEEMIQRNTANVSKSAPWTGKEPLSNFLDALDLEFRPGHMFGGLDEHRTPLFVGYVSTPATLQESDR